MIWVGANAVPVEIETRVNRRELLRRGCALGLGLGLAGFPAETLFAKAAVKGFPAIEALLAELVDSGKLPGVIAVVGQRTRPPKVLARGTLGFGSKAAMQGDTLFRIYSMTKLVTGMAAMELIDRGKLRLDQPIADLLPRFARMQVQVTPDGPLDQVRPARSQITVRHLLTHTAGLGYPITQTGPIAAAYVAAGLGGGRYSRVPLPGQPAEVSAPGLAAFADRLAELPLVYEPGTQWSYSVSLDLLGRVIELASGKSFDRFLEESIFAPCGMTDTGFQVPAAKAARLADNHYYHGGKLHLLDPGVSSIYLDPPPLPFGGSGLVSTPHDYDRFLAMLAGGGRLGHARVLGRNAVRLGGSNLLPPAANIVGSFVDSAGNGAGARTGVGAKAGVLGWSGAAGTVYRVDLKRGIRIAFYAQYVPSDAYAVYDTFPLAAARDLAAPQLI
jgi:CubicO group peptidase (beta-lactamase class C family)